MDASLVRSPQVQAQPLRRPGDNHQRCINPGFTEPVRVGDDLVVEQFNVTRAQPGRPQSHRPRSPRQVLPERDQYPATPHCLATNPTTMYPRQRGPQLRVDWFKVHCWQHSLCLRGGLQSQRGLADDLWPQWVQACPALNSPSKIFEFIHY